MNPAARLQTAIELVDRIIGNDRPADGTVLAFFRGRRFVGGGDRRAVSDQAWRIQRTRARLTWLLGADAPDARLLALADLIANERKNVDAAAGLFSGAKYGPPPLSINERRMAARVADYAGRNTMPRHARLECPAWLLPRLDAAFGDKADAEIAALNAEAALDLRVNTLKATRDEVLKLLREEGHAPQLTAWSPWGLRVAARLNLASHKGFRAGLFEVQDQASQVCAGLVDARPGQAVLDLCAGAGGKTLAMAATMANKGRIVACDVATGRLIRSKQRLRRAGAHNATLRILEGEHDKWLKRQKAVFDRVLVDAPCSGVGAWRRNPDARWRLAESDLANLAATQDKVLDQAAPLVKPGGRLIYATCSLLPEENQDRVAAFLARAPQFKPLPWTTVWPAALGTPPPPDDGSPHLTLTPARHGTDGFFVAILERME
ncbi:MAG: RsmB/NOP family class I SAM-dependent RNA methyltransferase [Rhodospirillaceae bacterium]|nr:RsmB/NOP family class I SAM-dependent RNA methyltransferase [Rhodospirillaceae bacterium]